MVTINVRRLSVSILGVLSLSLCLSIARAPTHTHTHHWTRCRGRHRNDIQTVRAATLFGGQWRWQRAVRRRGTFSSADATTLFSVGSQSQGCPSEKVVVISVFVFSIHHKCVHCNKCTAERRLCNEAIEMCNARNRLTLLKTHMRSSRWLGPTFRRLSICVILFVRCSLAPPQTLW